MRAVKTVFACLLALASAVLGWATPRAQENLPAMPAPLVQPAGGVVSLAWSLPRGTRLEAVLVLRALKPDGAFEEAARVPVTSLSWQDTQAALGATYLYRLQGLAGGVLTQPSPAVEVTVGGSARLLLRGGSTGRAVLEVTLFRGGRRLSATFVHGPGDAIGDLLHVPEVGAIVDFRLGPRLGTLALARRTGQETARETLLDAAGQPLTDPAGRPIQGAFRLPGAERELLLATVLMPDGTARELAEGESLDLPNNPR